MSGLIQSGGSSPPAVSKRKWRSNIFSAANGKCFYCGDPVIEPGCSHSRDWLVVRPASAGMVREHRVPTIRGGSGDASNTVCACRSCNTLKAAFTTDEFRVLMAFRRGDLNFRFPGEAPAPIERDWIVCHSAGSFERLLVVHNMPSAQLGYDMRNGHARGPKARARAR